MQRFIAYCFYTLFILVPLILTPWNYELFEFNKMLVVYAGTVIIAAAWLMRTILVRRWLIRRTPFDLPLALFLISQILSTLLSIDPRTSVLGYYSRFHGGLLSTLSYIILYYAFVSNLTLKHIRNTLYIILTTTTLVAAYGIAEHLGIDKTLWVQDVQNRVFSTLGQPNWLAAYLVTIIFIPIALHLSKPRPISYLLSLSAIYYLSLLYTKSRSGILGFAIAYFIFWGLIFLKTKLSLFPWKRFLAISSMLFAISLFDGLRWIPQLNRLLPSFSYQEQATPPSGSQLETGGSESGDIRRIVWKGALNVWRHYPLFGSGVETFAYSYYNFRPAEHNLVSEWDFLYNKAHNEYLNFLATTGLFGLGTYLLLQTWIFIWLLKHLSIFNVAFLAGLLGLSISNFFGFSTVPVALLFFLYPAFAVVLTRHETKN